MLDLVAAQKAAVALAERAGLRVKWHAVKDDSKFFTDTRGVLHIPQPDVAWSQAQIAWWRNGLNHEIGHWNVAVRDIWDLLKTANIASGCVFASVLNIVDDVRNDFNRVSVYPGTRSDNIEAWRQVFAEKLPEQAARLPNDAADPNCIPAVVLAASGALRAAFDDALVGPHALFRNALPDALQAPYETMQRDGWLDRWADLETADDEYTFTRDLLRDVFNIPESELPEEKPEDNQAAQQEQQKGNDEAKADSGGSDDDGEPGDEKGATMYGGRVTIDYEELLGQQHDDDYVDNRTGARVIIDYDNYAGERSYNPHTNATTKIGYPEDIIGKDLCALSHYRAVIDGASTDQLANRARQYLQTVSRKLWDTNLAKGRLDTRKLHKLASHRGNDAPAVFKQPAQRMRLDTAVSILIDNSGSMRGYDKHEFASIAGFAMATICNVLHIPCEIAAFTENGYSNCDNLHLIIKQFGDKLDKEVYTSRMAISSRTMVNNADGDSILTAFHRLAYRGESKKLLLVLSDGQPAAVRGDIYGYTKRVVTLIEQSSPVDILGIGMLDTTVERIYKHHKVIHSAEQIPEKLIEILRDHVISN